MDAITVVHNETSTGVTSPVGEIAAAVRQSAQTLVLVDAVSSFAGVAIPLDAWGARRLSYLVAKGVGPAAGTVFPRCMTACGAAGDGERPWLVFRRAEPGKVAQQEHHAVDTAITLMRALVRSSTASLPKGSMRVTRHAGLAELTQPWAVRTALTWQPRTVIARPP